MSVGPGPDPPDAEVSPAPPEGAAPWAAVLLRFVQQFPGVHLRELLRRLRIPPGTLDYHLRRLSRQGFLETRDVGGHRCVFPCRPIGAGWPVLEKDQVLLALLRRRVPRAILLHLTYFGPATGRELSDSAGVSSALLLYYVERLESWGLVERVSSPAGPRKAKVVDPLRVRDILLRHPPLKERFEDRWITLWERMRP